MKNSIRNLKLVFSQWKSWVIFTIATALFLRLSFAFFNYQLSLGNLWKFITYSEITLNILLSLLFGIFLAGQIYKIVMMQGKKRVHKRWFLGGVLGALFTGCPSCSIGITSFLGLGSLLSALPCHGLEVKVLALLLLLRSNWSMYQKLLVCNVKK